MLEDEASTSPDQNRSGAQAPASSSRPWSPGRAMYGAGLPCCFVDGRTSATLNDWRRRPTMLAAAAAWRRWALGPGHGEHNFYRDARRARSARPTSPRSFRRRRRRVQRSSGPSGRRPHKSTRSAFFPCVDVEFAEEGVMTLTMTSPNQRSPAPISPALNAVGLDQTTPSRHPPRPPRRRRTGAASSAGRYHKRSYVREWGHVEGGNRPTFPLVRGPSQRFDERQQGSPHGGPSFVIAGAS